MENKEVSNYLSDHNGEQRNDQLSSYHVNDEHVAEISKWPNSEIDSAFYGILNDWDATGKENNQQLLDNEEINNDVAGIDEEEEESESGSGDDGVDVEEEYVAELNAFDAALQSEEDDEINHAITTFRKWHLRGPARMKSETNMKEKGAETEMVTITKRKTVFDVGPQSESDNESCTDSDPGSYETGSDSEGNRVYVKRKPIWPRYNEKAKVCHIELGMVFKSHFQFRRAIIKYSIQSKRDFTYVRNESTRIRAICKAKGCPWEIYAAVEKRKNYFQVKMFSNEHTCYEVQNISRATSMWMTNEVRELITWHPGIKPGFIQEQIQNNFKIEFSIHQARRTKLQVMKKFERDVSYEYARLGDYANALRIANPGSTIEIQVSDASNDGSKYFERMYTCFAALKKGFLLGCRPFIGLDGCFLKGIVKGQLLTAVGKDGNNQMYPLAWAIVEVESKDSWIWFLERLKCDIETIDGKEWTFMSDQQKGLIHAVAYLFPKAEHRLCARHIYSNWCSKFRGDALRDAFYACAKSTNESTFKKNLEEMERLKEGATAAAVRIDPKTWCKAYFAPKSKCDSVDNNCCEAFNFVLVRARSKPIIPMLEEIREYIMERQVKRRLFCGKWAGEYGKRIMLKLEKNINESYRWQALWNGDYGYEVKSGLTKYSVHLDIKHCECGAWQLSGIPCIHACRAIRKKGDAPMDYLEKWFKKEMFMKSYSYSIEVMSSEEMWADCGFGVIKPPVIRVMPGRPRKCRRKSKHEPQKKKNKLSRDGRQMTCSLCGGIGHNKRGCKNGQERAAVQIAGTSRTTKTGGQGREVALKGIVGVGIYTDSRTGQIVVNPGLPSQHWV